MGLEMLSLPETAPADWRKNYEVVAADTPVHRVYANGAGQNQQINFRLGGGHVGLYSMSESLLHFKMTIPASASTAQAAALARIIENAFSVFQRMVVRCDTAQIDLDQLALWHNLQAKFANQLWYKSEGSTLLFGVGDALKARVLNGDTGVDTRTNVEFDFCPEMFSSRSLIPVGYSTAKFEITLYPQPYQSLFTLARPAANFSVANDATNSEFIALGADAVVGAEYYELSDMRWNCLYYVPGQEHTEQMLAILDEARAKNDPLAGALFPFETYQAYQTNWPSTTNVLNWTIDKRINKWAKSIFFIFRDRAYINRYEYPNKLSNFIAPCANSSTDSLEVQFKINGINYPMDGLHISKYGHAQAFQMLQDCLALDNTKRDGMSIRSGPDGNYFRKTSFTNNDPTTQYARTNFHKSETNAIAQVLAAQRDPLDTDSFILGFSLTTEREYLGGIYPGEIVLRISSSSNPTNDVEVTAFVVYDEVWGFSRSNCAALTEVTSAR